MRAFPWITGQCPSCGGPAPEDRTVCLCESAEWLRVPRGHKLHTHCPVHGDVDIFGLRLRLGV